MRVTVFTASARTFWRDRSAMALALILPPLIYLVFAQVFGSAGAGDIDIRLALYRDDGALLDRLETRLGEHDQIAALVAAASPEDAANLVRTGAADAGVAILSNGPGKAPSFTLYTAGVRKAAGLVAEQALASLRPAADQDATSGASFTRASVEAVNEAAAANAYYAAGVSMLFVFLAGFQSALTLFDERAAGVYERFAARPGAVGAAIDGKTLFIAAQGLLQIAVIFLVAGAMGVNLFHAPLMLLASAVIVSLSASGLIMGLTALCRSRGQAHALGIVATLLFAAIGGSMAPRFLMPEAAQRIGALTPNGLGIDVFAASLWTGAGWQSAATPLVILAALGLAGWALARFFGPAMLTSATSTS